MEKYYSETIIEVPVVALRGLWIFPHMIVNFDVGRDISKRAVEEALARNSIIMLTTQKDATVEKPELDEINSMGIVAKIKQTITLPNGNVRVFIEGINRAEIQEFIQSDEYYFVKAVEYKREEIEENIELKAIRRLCLEDLEQYTNYRDEIPREAIYGLKGEKDASIFSDLMASYLRLELQDYQDLLEEIDVYKRLILLHEFMTRELEILKLEFEINQKVKTNINKSQKEYYLKEQLQIIKTELGEENLDPDDYITEYIEKIEALSISDEHKEHLNKEAKRLKFMSQGSPEINVIRTYLDYALEIPWGVYTKDIIDIKKSKSVLDRDHFGLKDVKERILEFISVRKLKKDMKGSILCLVGPPGVGKTSIVKSVAESMNRNYISMRLGGLADESEIRGHRKTYIGSMPGRIITNLIEGKSLNPVFLLDEIDKISADYKADPASALLEVLDPNQNNKFLDRYLEIPIDLSQVMFVTTANSVSTIPRALLDRMEVIQISGYTSSEKFEIAKKYLLPKQTVEHGLTSSQFKITDSVIKKIINNYTREAGVRNLERMIAKASRKTAMKIVDGAESVTVNLKNYKEFLGRELILDDEIIREPIVGLVTGLAWTQVGGELLQIEVNVVEGKGKIQLTGSLGNVMKESAMAAISYIRSDCERYGIDKEFHDKYDIHIHVPEGATPKDGPSAGITMTTALISALTNRKVRQDVAMTGEVTIRGRVLPIGGLKEKSLAANRYGINTVIIPKQNERDLEDIPDSIRKNMEFIAVKNVQEVLDIALLK
ncbi:MAG: endopeptidase La [Tissierellia bacterium]|nr:endopeptidase La [Tissierellia bacterium]